MSEIENFKEAIQTAIQMEKDGHSFYKKAAAQTSSNMGKAIFESLAEDELSHLDVFQKIFEENVGKEEWGHLVNSSKKYADLSVFPKDLEEIEGANPDTSELDAIRIAMDSEQEAIDYYTKIKADSNDEKIIRVLDEIIEQEKGHYQVLESEFNHITKTGYWFELDYLGG